MGRVIASIDYMAMSNLISELKTAIKYRDTMNAMVTIEQIVKELDKGVDPNVLGYIDPRKRYD